MKLNQIYVLLLVIIAVFLAGCAKQESVATAGVVIEKFSSQVSTVPSNSPVELTLIVRNSGEREAKDVKAVLGGLNFLTESIASRGDLAEEDKQQYWRSENRGAFKDRDFLKNSDPSSLLGEDTLSGFQGGQGTVIWRLTSPVQARDQTYELTVNLVYGYSTVSTILIKAVSFNYLQSLPEIEQKSIDTGVTVSKTTKGPIEISVKSDQAIISDSSTLPIEIEFRNIGGGKTFLGGGQETEPSALYENIKSGINTISVELPSDLKCNLEVKGSTEKGFKYIVRLIEGKSGRILCNKAIGGISTVQTLSMDITALYAYLIEGKTAVKVSKTLYQPPIVDISIQDSSVDEIIHEHGETTSGKVNLVLRNVGNKPITGKEIGINYELFVKDTSVKRASDIVDLASVTLNSFDSRKTINSPIPTGNLQIDKLASLTLKVDTGKLTGLAERVDTGTTPLPDEENLDNNNLNKPIPLDYDIAVENLKAKVKDARTFSVEITATVVNNGKNVIGKNIPFEVKVGDIVIDHTTCVSEVIIPNTKEKETLEKLPPLTSQEIICTYDNPDKKLEFGITANVPISELETNKQNNINSKPNGEATFKIIYDLRLIDIKSEVVPGGFNKETGEVTYKLSAKVKNVGNVVANIGTVAATTTDSTVEFESNVREPLCQKLEGSIGELEPTKVSGEFVCTTHPIPSDEFSAVARIIGAPSKPDKTVDEKTFTVISPSKRVLRLEIVSNKGELAVEPTVNKDISNGQFNYRLTTEVKNSGTVAVKDISVRFVDSVGNEFCQVLDTSNRPLSITLQPGEKSGEGGHPTLSCLTTFLPSKKFDATATITATDTLTGQRVEKKESFVVDSNVKQLIFADITEPSFSWELHPSVGTAESNAFQSFKFSKNSRLTKISVALDGVASGPKLSMKIREDGNNLPDTAKVPKATSPTVSVPASGKIELSFNFNGESLSANTRYWVELQCESPCSVPRHKWKYNRDDVYSAGNGVVISIITEGNPRYEYLQNNADFGFKVFGIEK